MLKPMYFWLILSLVFFSCNRQQSDERVAIEEVKTDSVATPPEQEDRVEDLLLIAGSVQKPFDTQSLQFNLSGKNYEVVYKKGERLYFFDSKSRDRLVFPDTGRVFQFALSSDGNTLYYTVINEEALVLKRARLGANKANISGIRRFTIPLNDFISGFPGQDSRIGIHGDILSIGHGMINEHLSFSSQYHIVATPDSTYLIESLPLRYSQKSTEDYRAHIAAVSEKLRLVKKGEHKELFLVSNPDSIQISDIHSLLQDSLYMEHYSDREYALETDEDFDRTLFKTVEFSPDGSKILYSYPCVMYDFVHGPMYVVNVNGDKLKRLCIDGGFSREQRTAWLADGNNVVFHRFAKDDSSGLFMTINSENDFIRIDEDVPHFEIR